MARVKETQRDKILNYMKAYGSITSWEAYEDLGITQLAARIFELKKLGYIFGKETVKRLNRYGQPVSFDKYTLVMEGTA